jgi:hypothetical protein
MRKSGIIEATKIDDKAMIMIKAISLNLIEWGRFDR